MTEYPVPTELLGKARRASRCSLSTYEGRTESELFLCLQPYLSPSLFRLFSPSFFFLGFSQSPPIPYLPNLTYLFYDLPSFTFLPIFVSCVQHHVAKTLVIESNSLPYPFVLVSCGYDGILLFCCNPVQIRFSGTGDDVLKKKKVHIGPRVGKSQRRLNLSKWLIWIKRERERNAIGTDVGVQKRGGRGEEEETKRQIHATNTTPSVYSKSHLFFDSNFSSTLSTNHSASPLAKNT